MMRILKRIWRNQWFELVAPVCILAIIIGTDGNFRIFGAFVLLALLVMAVAHAESDASRQRREIDESEECDAIYQARVK